MISTLYQQTQESPIINHQFHELGIADGPAIFSAFKARKLRQRAWPQVKRTSSTHPDGKTLILYCCGMSDVDRCCRLFEGFSDGSCRCSHHFWLTPDKPKRITQTTNQWGSSLVAPTQCETGSTKPGWSIILFILITSKWFIKCRNRKFGASTNIIQWSSISLIQVVYKNQQTRDSYLH